MTTYQLRQPTKLESLSIEKLAAWIATQVEKFMSPISELHQPAATLAEAALSQEVENIRNHFEFKMPGKFHNALLSNTVTELVSLFQKSKYENLWYKSVSETKVIKRMIESLFTKNLTCLSLNFYQFTMFRDSLLSKSYLLTGLTSLHLKFETLAISHLAEVSVLKVITNNVISLLEDLHSLKHLTINYICTDDILRCIAKNCKLIEELNVSLSNKVDDSSIDILSQLHNMRSINLDRTSVRGKGIEKILLRFKNLEHIVIPHTSDDTNRMPYVLEQIANSKEKFPKLFKIKAYSSSADTLEKLQLLVQMCPLIQSLYIHVFTDRRRQCNIMAITALRGLRELTLEGFDYTLYDEQVNAALKLIRFNLVHLHLLRVMQIDLIALLDISEMCPNLESLSLDSCTFLNQARLCTEDLEIHSFRNLKKLIFDTSSSFDIDFDRYISAFVRRVASDVHEHASIPLTLEQDLKIICDVAFFLLSNCFNVELIQLSRSTWLTEDFMLKVLEKNPLIYLKELKICQYQSRSPISMPVAITTPVLQRIIENCRNCPQVILEGPTPSETGTGTPLELQLELLTL